MIFAKTKKLVHIHKIRHNKNIQSIFSQNFFRFHVKNSFKFGTILLMDCINLSYIHVITAIVQPLTQGITSHAHISIPFIKIRILSCNFFIRVTIKC